MNRLAFAHWQCVVVLLVCVAWRPAVAMRLDSSSEHEALRQLGLLLGLPVDQQQEPEPPTQQAVPDFVQGLYECLSSNLPSNCLPGYHADDVNLLRTSLGKGEITLIVWAVHVNCVMGT